MRKEYGLIPFLVNVSNAANALFDVAPIGG